VKPQPLPDGVISGPAVREMRVEWACRAYVWETDWANAIVGGQHQLADVPALAEYRAIVGDEWREVAACGIHRHHHVLVVGGGPLPLRAIVLAADYGIGSIVIDWQPHAVALASAVVGRLGLSPLIAVVHADGAIWQQMTRFNVVLVAAMVGMDGGERRRVLENVQRQIGPDAHLIARAAGPGLTHKGEFA
jgi:threonine dehydrogenase-like Zn-dependent dehydrogenase